MTIFCYIVISLRYCADNTLTKGGLIVLLLFFAQFSTIHAQYFNNRIDFLGINQGGENGFSIEKMNDGNYLVFLGALSPTGDNYIIGRAIINTSGEMIANSWNIDETGRLYNGSSNSSTKIPNGYVSSGSKTWFGQIYEELITFNRYDEQGELMWLRFYGDSIRQSIGRAATRQSDGTLAATGGISQSSNDVDGFLLLTDSLGELIDMKFYGGTGMQDFISISPTSDGGYVMGGMTWFSVDKKSHYIVKTDGLGNHQWSRVLGTPLDDCWASVIQTSDDNYVFCGCLNAELQNIYYKRLFMAKLGPTGQPIWQNTYQDHYSDNHQLRTVKEISNGDLVACGYTFGASRGVLLRTDADGNEKWYREYAHPSQPGIGYPHLVHDFIQEDDGGFVATGWLWVPPNGDEPGQDLWVFRTDSMGCLVPGCHLTDNITMHSNEVSVSLYPNPVQNQLSVHIKAGELPQGSELILYDLQGREQQRAKVEHGAVTYILDMRNLTPGIYLLHCTTPSEKLWTGKVMKN